MKPAPQISGLTVTQRTILARVNAILPPKLGKNHREYRRVLWSIYDPELCEIVAGYTDIVEGYRNSEPWNRWLVGLEINSIWQVVVHDNLNRSLGMICIDADYPPMKVDSQI